jgi:hypothetical protein
VDTNTTVLIIVATMAALALTGMVTFVVRKTRTHPAHGLRATIGTQVRENTLRLRRLEVLTVESAAPPHGPTAVAGPGSP